MDWDITISLALLGAVLITYYYRRSKKPRIRLVLGALLAANIIAPVIFILFTMSRAGLC